MMLLTEADILDYIGDAMDFMKLHIVDRSHKVFGDGFESNRILPWINLATVSKPHVYPQPFCLLKFQFETRLCLFSSFPWTYID
ncbi:hypothetical protein RJT34_04359 [Clitoria ternatea]|uniref:Uncharacterized protein n=1 Tax=Clitoria ternatea TaxID=43366 RepID=A0AAN9KMH1_CLITE